jgi:hypothetical protein
MASLELIRTQVRVRYTADRLPVGATIRLVRWHDRQSFEVVGALPENQMVDLLDFAQRVSQRRDLAIETLTYQCVPMPISMRYP